MINMDKCDQNIRVKAELTGVINNSFIVFLGTTGNDRILYNAGVSMMQFPALSTETPFRVGYIRARAGIQTVFFGVSFPQGVTPSVFIGLRGIDSSSNNWNGRFRAMVGEVTNAYFTLDVRADDTALHECMIQWIAFPSNMPGIEIGTFSSNRTEEGRFELRNSSHTTPSVFTGITGWDVGRNDNMRFRVRATATA